MSAESRPTRLIAVHPDDNVRVVAAEAGGITR